VTEALQRVTDDLEAVVTQMGNLDRLLLVLDFDGTLSPIVSDPAEAALVEGAMVALEQADENVSVVVMSGRTVTDLRGRLGDLAITLVGTHGAEARRADGTTTVLFNPSTLRGTLDTAEEKIARITGGTSGWIVERKSHSLAVHYRRVAPVVAKQVVPRVRTALASYADEPPGWEVLDGKRVLELRPRGVDKGQAMYWLAAQHPGLTPVVVGDDVTDEDAFRAAARLGGAGVVVSPIPHLTSAARWRLSSPERVVRLLVRLVEAKLAQTREETHGRPRYHPIGSYGLIGDSRTAALVSPDGSIDWMCAPRFDSPSLFAAILDADRGGRWRIRPVDDENRLSVQRTYLGETNVLVTRFVDNGDPVLTLTDLLVYSRVSAYDRRHSGHVLIRRIEAFAAVEVEISVQPRFDYARATTTIEVTEGGLRAEAGDDWVELDADDVDFTIEEARDGGPVARARVRMSSGDESWHVLRTKGSEHSPHQHLTPRQQLDLTVRTWGRWARLIEYDGPWRDAIVRSALVLKALVYEPTGALVAAPTTSLPEDVGGERNWDYRYSWIRDSAYVLETFLRIGHAREAETFIRWLSELGEHIGGAHELRPLYRVTGEDDLVEFELDHLEGYRGSRPVRIGNGAASQVQLDIYGAAMQLGYLTEQLGGEVPSTRWDVIVELVESVSERWRDPDSGLWEIRSAPRHHTFSKFQCWLAVDRAIRVGEGLGLPGPFDRWRKVADEIRESVLTEGFNDELGAFTQAYDGTEMDASLLLLPLKGFIDPTDWRVRGTVDAIRRDLEIADGFLLRYRTVDGLAGGEGAFLMCSFWLVEVLARMGELDEAVRLFERLRSLGGPLGLFAEEVDPATHAHLGNYPQGFTHMALIAAATAIVEERARREAAR